MSKQQLVNFVNVHADVRWKALGVKARSPEKLLDVCYEKVTDEDVFSFPQHDYHTKKNPHEGTHLEQQRGQRACASAFDPDTDVPYHEEHVIAVRKESNLRLEFYRRDVSLRVQTPALRCTMSVWIQCERNPICNLTSTC